MSESINYQIAERFFGWKWVAFHGVPVRSAPGYPEECRVRRFVSTEVANRMECEPATGDEPLSYGFAMQCPAYFSADWTAIRDLEKELKRRGLLQAYISRTKWEHGCLKRCRVALELLDRWEGGEAE